MIPLAIPNLVGNERMYLNECIDSTFVSTVGPFVSQFEKMVGEASGCNFVVATSAGTTGLHAALIAAGVLPGDLVIIPALSFIATANAVAHAHAQPWMLDINPQSWTLDPLQLEKSLRSESDRDQQGNLRHKPTGKRIAAIMPVHTLGVPADMDPIISLAREYGLPVVADGAAALGARYKGRNICELGADLTMFSFNGNKTVTAGGGGAICGGDSVLIDMVRHLTTTARVGLDYEHDMVGFNYRMTNIQAAVGCAQMELLPKFVTRKREIRQFYNKRFSKFKSILPFPAPEYAESACWFSGFVIRQGNSAVLRTRLRERGIDARSFWRPLHLQVPYRLCPRGDLSVSEDLWQRIVTLPCSSGISDFELDQVAVIVDAELG